MGNSQSSNQGTAKPSNHHTHKSGALLRHPYSQHCPAFINQGKLVVPSPCTGHSPEPPIIYVLISPTAPASSPHYNRCDHPMKKKKQRIRYVQCLRHLLLPASLPPRQPLTITLILVITSLDVAPAPHSLKTITLLSSLHKQALAMAPAAELPRAPALPAAQHYSMRSPARRMLVLASSSSFMLPKRDIICSWPGPESSGNS